jgi:hypothetical protein
MFSIKASSKAVILAMTSAFVFGTAGSAMAVTQWQKDHPRRTEVNKRLNNQDRRIHQERKEGEISKAQAQKLHREDHGIRKEERTMAAQDGGHITKQEQRTLNRQENAVSRQIGQ